MSNEKLEFGAYQVIYNCLRVQPNEKVCIITDKVTRHIGEAIAKNALKITEKVKMFIMEDFGTRSKDGSNPLPFPDEIKNYMLKSQVSVYCAPGEKGELHSFRIPMTKLADEKGLRHAHMISITDLLMEMGMNADYAAIKENNAKIMKKVAGAKTAHVTTDLGTDLHVELNPEWKWINCDGNIQPGHWTNLPDGEVFTCAANANGKVIVDGVLGDWLSEKYGEISKTPVTIVFKDSRIQSVSCSNKDIEKDVIEYSKQDENANRLSEFAVGTNLALDRLVGNLLQDEKFPSVHIAIGDGYKDKTGCTWESKGHLDMVITKTTVVVGGNKIMEKGKFVV